MSHERGGLKISLRMNNSKKIKDEEKILVEIGPFQYCSVKDVTTTKKADYRKCLATLMNDEIQC